MSPRFVPQAKVDDTKAEDKDNGYTNEIKELGDEISNFAKMPLPIRKRDENSYINSRNLKQTSHSVIGQPTGKVIQPLQLDDKKHLRKKSVSPDFLLPQVTAKKY